MNDSGSYFLLIFVLPMVLAAAISVSVSYLAKIHGRNYVPAAMLSVWAATVSIYLVTTEPAPAYLGESVTLKWGLAFAISAGLVLLVVALPIWYLVEKWPLGRALTAAIFVSLSVGFFFGPTYYIVLCILRGTCDP